MLDAIYTKPEYANTYNINNICTLASTVYI